MKFYKFKAEGKLWAQRVTSEPTTTEGDIGRLFFGTSNNYLSIRNNTGWSQLWDADNIDALSAAIAADATSTANLVAALDPSFIRKDEADSTPFTVGFGGLTLAGDIDMNSSYQIVNLQAPDTAGQAIRQTTNVTEANLNTLTGGGDTTLHDHDGISENTAARHTQGTDTTLGTMAGDIDMNNSYQIVNLQAPDASGQAIRQTTNVTEANLNTLTGGGDTTLHDHAGISENTAARHTQGTDTTLGTMAANINMNGFNVLGANSFTINDDGDNEGFMGPGNAWGFHHPTAAQGGYDAVEITIDDPFQIKNGASLRLQHTTAGSLCLTSGTGVTEFYIAGT
ncbi:MAG: hypothetical protein KAJ19_19070, partial [Gammaproteobacteria bacterium]|nr:hypothetical protein [Gammaproteobacteria bacterium]